jgi:hypothetical protein
MTQLKDVLWGNFSKWIGISLISDDLVWQEMSIKHTKMPHPHYAAIRPSNRAANMQGQHAKHLLWLIDEAYGIVKNDVWETINGSLTNDDNKIITAGQPTMVTGYCADLKNPKRSPEYIEPRGICLRFSSLDAPPSICKPEWLEDMKNKWGVTHDVYRVRVLGLPPLGNPKAFITLQEAQGAVDREEVDTTGAVEIGVDPARDGDDLCVMAVRKGCKYFPLETMPKSDEIEIAAMILRRVREIRMEKDPAFPYRLGFKGRIRVKIGVAGGYGAGAADILKRNKKDNIEVVEVQEGGGGNEDYGNASAVMWAEFKNALPKLSLPDDDDLVGQLCSRETDIDMKGGKTWMEAKKKYKARMGHSPDRADAVIICWTEQAAKAKLIEGDISGSSTKIVVNWKTLSPETVPMIALYTDKETKTGAAVVLWKQETSTVYVLLSRDYDCARPEKIFADLSETMNRISDGFVRNIKTFEWFGNKPYDNIGLGTIRDTWSKAGINVRANPMFNIDGAVLAVNRFLSRKGIIFDDVWAGQLIVDLQGWYAEEKEGAPNSILALASIISVINDGTYINRQRPIPKFSPESTEVKKRFEENIQTGRPFGQTNADSDSWMF